jgi:type IV secretion system protein VirB4
VLLNGGAVYSFGSRGSTQFQPLAFINEPTELVQALGWLQQCLEATGERVTPASREALGKALQLRAEDDQKRRTMTALVKDLKSRAPHLATALRVYTNEGPYGYIFDGDSASALERKRWTMFDIGPLLKLEPEAKVPALRHLRQRISRWYDGTPTLEIWDECPVTFSEPSLQNDAIYIVDTQRKNNVRALLIAQTPGQLSKFPDLMKSVKSGCATKIYGPDAEALSQAKEYAELGVNEVELRELTKMPIGSYMLKNQRGCRRFDMNLGPIQKALAGMTGTDEQAFLASLHERCSDADEMLREVLKFKRLEKRARELLAWKKNQRRSEVLAAE